ncbi:MAG TPA: sialidase family protein [Pyrinomonadaceae bacterium]|jgi:hypothetical protein
MLSRKQVLAALVVMLMLLVAGCARQGDKGSRNKESGGAAAASAPLVRAEQPVRVSAEQTDAAEPSLAAAGDGSLYVVWVEHGANKTANVMLARRDAEGQSAGAPVRVNPQAGQAVAWRGDPPTVAVAPDRTIYVGWTASVAAPGGHANDLYLSASRDGGQTFAAPVKVNDDRRPSSHGMHSLAVGADGRVYMAWLDERNVAPPAPPPAGQAALEHKMERMESNSETFTAFSTDGGRTFSPNQRISTEVCPCCKTSLAVDADGRVYVSWRQVLPGDYRHIAVSTSGDGGRTFSAPVIVSDDRWMIAGCPVSGPALAVGADGRLRVLWYTAGKRGTPGLYWAESSDGGKTFTESRPFAGGPANGTPRVIMNGSGQLVAVWENNDGGAARVMAARLGGEGAPGSQPPLSEGAELPSAAAAGDQLFIGYITKIKNQRSIWLVRARVAA